MEDVEGRRPDARRRPASAVPVDPGDEIRALLELAALNQALAALEQMRRDLAQPERE